MSACACSGGTFDLPGLERRAAELSEQAAAPGFWSDAEKAQAVGRETAQGVDALAQYRRQREGVDEAQVFLELAEEGDAEALGELRDTVEPAEAEPAALERKQPLGGGLDAGPSA